MSIKAKLFLFFILLSMVVVVLGIIRYSKLENIIAPLKTQSIPLSVKRLEKAITTRDVFSQLQYRQLLTEQYLEDFVYTARESSLQSYYLNEELLRELIEKLQAVDTSLWLSYEKYQLKMADAMKNNPSSAKQLLLSDDYTMLSRQLSDNLRNIISNEDTQNTSVKVSIGMQEISDILRSDLDSLVIVFIDAVLISLALAYWGAEFISKPINILRNEMEKMDKSNLNLPIDASLLKLKGEIGDLARSFAALMMRLRNTTVLRDELLVEISRREQFEKQLQLTARKLEESNVELNQFAYAASHDLRAPLRGIENLVDWIEEDCYNRLPENSQKHLLLIKSRVKRLDNLIGGILEYSRISMSQAQKENVDVGKLLSDIIEDLSPPQYIAIHIDNKMPVLHTYKVMLTQVFLNLINNAIKFHNKSNGNINIGVQVFEEYFQFYVSDDGPGIDAKYHEKIFTIFQTLQSRDEVETTGIGLATVKKIVERQGGKIWLSSVVGRGSTFYFTWLK